MAKGLNKIMLIGNLGKDPELRGESGSVCKFSLAVNGSEKRGDQWVDDVRWFEVVVFGKAKDAVMQFCKKGDKVFVEGRAKPDRFNKDDGTVVYTFDIIASNVIFLPSGQGGGDSGGHEGPGGGFRGQSRGGF